MKHWAQELRNAAIKKGMWKTFPRDAKSVCGKRYEEETSESGVITNRREAIVFFPQNQLLNFSKRKASLEAEHRSNPGNNCVVARKGSKAVKAESTFRV